MLSAYLNALFPVVFCAALGLVLARTTTLLDSPALSKLVTMIGLPALILNAMLGMETPIWSVSDTLMAILAVLALSAVVGAVGLKLAGLEVRGYLSMLVNPNTGNLGIPLVFSLLGDQALVHAVVISTTVQISHFTLGVWLLSGRFSLKAILSNASIVALLVGIVWVATGLQAPQAVVRTLDMLAGMTIPVMLLLLGRSLSTINPRDLGHLGRIAGLSVGRVALGMGAALAVISVLPLDPIVSQTLLIQASMPVAVISYILASHYNGPKDDIAAVILISMPISLLAVFGVLQFF
ncbi:AEC family transporter [Marinobacter nanhaiticus D15-8W]|uniref:AEC family transporter n=1 Tax=Marinobacter nanhaiticus D15-8W TaxID=626887 RepID=N6VY72_9GAMM|nr:AEC family transporter [Marinobacter nanhaiticus]ENO12819.1 AEC family transporter [Marinobacter nanhaiticus D15-8W]BES70167.1 AEC family transporter [Marinobacter nanhaiticus D15-8W]